MLGTPVCDELRGYLDVKVPSAARKKGLLINWKAWRRRWLVVRRFLVSSPLSHANCDEVAILGRRIELKLTGDDSGNSAAPCPVVVVEEWQEDALVCPTKSRSHPYAFGLFPQPGCEPVLFLSGRSAEESRRWLASIRSLLVPPFRPSSFRLSSISSSLGDDVDVPLHHSSPLSSSPEAYHGRCVPKSQHICFPPLPPLPSRCRLRRRSSLESLTAPAFLMDRRRSLSDSEIPNSTSSEHHRHKCQTISKAIDVETSKTELLGEEYDQHIYAGIGDSGVCSSMSNFSRSFLSSSSSSSCSSSSGLYAYASPSTSGFTSYLKEHETEEVSTESILQTASLTKVDDPSQLTGKVASSLVSAGIGLMLSTPVNLDRVPDVQSTTCQRDDVQHELGRLIPAHCRQEDMDRRESITSGIYEEIQDDDLSSDESKNLSPAIQVESGHEQSPPPLPPRSPSQAFHLLNGKQKDLAWFLGVHRTSNSCPTSDVEDDEPSRDGSPVNGQDSDALIMPRRKISEPSGIAPSREGSRTATIGHSRRKRKNLESFLGVMEFGSRAKEMNKTGVNVLNKSLGALELTPKGERGYIEKEWQRRTRTYTESARSKLDNLKFQDSNRSSSTGALLSTDICKATDVSQTAKGTDKSGDYEQTKTDCVIEKEENGSQNCESQNNELENPPPMISENAKISLRIPLLNDNLMERCHSFSCSSLKSCQTSKLDGSDKRDQSPKSPRSIAKCLQMVKPNLMKLLLKEQTRQQELPNLRDKTKSVINRSLETLGWLSLATSQFEDSSCNVTVGGSSFYRSATCTGVDMQNERQNALRQAATGKDGGKVYEIMTLGRRRTSTKIPLATEVSATEMIDIPSSMNLLEDSAICPYHKSQLKIMEDGIGHTLEDIERLAKQELICERICNSKTNNDPYYIPMRPLKKDEEETLFSTKDLDSQTKKRVSVVAEEDYVSMEGIRTSTCKMESFDSVIKEDSTDSAYRNDGDIYMSMEGRKSTQEELAQR